MVCSLYICTLSTFLNRGSQHFCISILCFTSWSIFRGLSGNKFTAENSMCALWNITGITSLYTHVQNAINSRKFSELCLAKVIFSFTRYLFVIQCVCLLFPFLEQLHFEVHFNERLSTLLRPFTEFFQKSGCVFLSGFCRWIDLPCLNVDGHLGDKYVYKRKKKPYTLCCKAWCL